jgi:hypothetical protein
MGSGTWRRFLSGALFGVACGVATFAIAVVSGYSLAQVQLTSGPSGPPPPTLTVEEMQRALERLTAQPVSFVTPVPVDWGVGTTYPTPEATPAPGSTPASSPPASSSSTLRGGAATPVVTIFDDEDVTPQATPSSGLSAIPTATPFVPASIVPIQPIGTPPAR